MCQEVNEEEVEETCVVCGRKAKYDTMDEGGDCYCEECYYENVQSLLVKTAVKKSLDDFSAHYRDDPLIKYDDDGLCNHPGCPVCDPRYRNRKPPKSE